MNNKITYHKVGDYYLPNLVMPKENTNYQIGKYGRMKLNYLKSYKKAEYFNLLMDCALNRYLHEIDVVCNDRINAIIPKLANQENITEELIQCFVIKRLLLLYYRRQIWY